MDDNECKIIDLLEQADEPLSDEQIIKQTGIEPKEVGRILNKLKDEGKITSPKSCFHQLA